MENLPFYILGVYAIVGMFIAIALVVLIVKRINDKDKEDFENRSN